MNARLREAAAMLCSAMATDRATNEWLNLREIADALSTPIEAQDLALGIQYTSWDELGRTSSVRPSDYALWLVAWTETWALACSLLRSGEFQGGE